MMRLHRRPQLEGWHKRYSEAYGRLSGDQWGYIPEIVEWVHPLAVAWANQTEL